MKIKLSLLAILASTYLLNASSNQNVIQEDITLKFIQSVIPNTQISKYESSEVQGFYKIYLENGNLFYVNPSNKLILFGEIWNNTGFSYTQNDRAKWQSELSKEVITELNSKYTFDDFKNIAKSVKYGKGSTKYEFILFTDPECPYCKITEEYFEDNKNLDLHIVFTPLDFHKNAENWALKALSSKDLKQALKDIKSNKIPNVKITDKAKKELESMKKLATDLKVTGTPKIIVIDSKTKEIIDNIEGANIKAIEKYQMENK